MRRTGATKKLKAKRVLRVALLLLFGLAIGLAMAELGLRVLNGWLHANIYAVDAELGWRHCSGADRMLQDEDGRSVRFVTDADGLRIAPKQPQASSRRVLFLGDSFTQGSEVAAEETFAELLAKTQTDVTACNAGVGGYSTVQELLALPGWLDKLRPELVVLVLYDNDFIDNLMPYFAGLGPKPYVRIRDGAAELVTTLDVASFEPFLQPAPGAYWLYQHCAIYRTVHKNLFLPKHADRLDLRQQADRDATPIADRLLAMQMLLRQIVQRSKAAGCDILVAAIPKRQEAEVGKAPTHLWLAEQCQELNVPFVSLLRPLHESNAAACYFAQDIHLRRAGHQCVAAALAPKVAAALAR